VRPVPVGSRLRVTRYRHFRPESAISVRWEMEIGAL
jgi:hypothetical protein